MWQAERIPEATIISNEDDVAPAFLMKNSNSFETSNSVHPAE